MPSGANCFKDIQKMVCLVSKKAADDNGLSISQVIECA
jgi:hypothetical protein